MSFKPTFKPECYQDVKTNLTWYTSIITLIFFFLFGILFADFHQNNTEKIEKVKGFFKLLEISWLFVISYILIILFEIHDKVYDRFIIRWRYYYDIDFILPRLTQPLANKLSSSFYTRAQKNKYDFMKPFYVFVGDGDGELRIAENLRTRFYEIILKYWITQINEILLLSSYVIIVIATFRNSSSNKVLLMAAIAVLGLYFINRILVYTCRNSVRQTTIDEIDEIHSRFPSELDEEFKKLHEKFSMNYG